MIGRAKALFVAASTSLLMMVAGGGIITSTAPAFVLAIARGDGGVASAVFGGGSVQQAGCSVTCAGV